MKNHLYMILIVTSVLGFSWVAHAADLYSSGPKTWDRSASNWGTTSGGPYTTTTWNNAAPDGAVFEGTVGTVTLGKAVTLKNITFASKNGGYTLSGSALNFVNGGVIDQTVQHIDHTISAPITGSRDVRIINNAGGTYSGLKFSGGALAGNATIDAPVSVPATGNLSPGGPVGVLSVRGDLDLSAQANGSGKLIFELDAPDAVSDRINVTGTANIGDFDFSNLGGMEAGTYVLIATTDGIIGTLDPADRSGVIGDLRGDLQIKDDNLEWATDLDIDGMPDDFELAHTTTPSATALKPGEDLEHGGDGDGLTNLDKYLRDTDPNNPDSDGDGLEDGPEVAGEAKRPPTDPANDDTVDEVLHQIWWTAFVGLEPGSPGFPAEGELGPTFTSGYASIAPCSGPPGPHAASGGMGTGRVEFAVCHA